MSFAAATAVQGDGDGRFAAEIHPGWDVVGNAHGGYLLAIAARAGAVIAGRPDPVTVTGHFLAPGTPGPVTITTGRVGGGRRFSTVNATVLAGERPVVTMLGTYADLASTDRGAPELHAAGPPDLPPPDDCVRVQPGTPLPPAFTGRVDLRLHPDDAGGTTIPDGEMRFRGWFRLLDGERLDPFALVMATDAFPPAVFRSGLPVGWTPTIELTAHVRTRPTTDWLAGVVSTRFVVGGFLEMDAELWEPAGRLVAQGRQLALVPRG